MEPDEIELFEDDIETFEVNQLAQDREDDEPDDADFYDDAED
jgi:hypothetical protein